MPLPDEPVVHQAVALIEAMLAPDIERRPNASEVEKQASWILGEETVPPDEASAPALDAISTRVQRDTESAPVGSAQPPTASFFVEAADDPVVGRSTALRTPDSMVLPKAPPDRPGPTWPIAIFMASPPRCGRCELRMPVQFPPELRLSPGEYAVACSSSWPQRLFLNHLLALNGREPSED